jgi:hypothetical protein
MHPRTQFPLEWLKGLPKADQEEFKKYVLSSKKVLDKLSEIVYNKIKVGESVSKNDYDSPSWSHRQAHDNGRNEAFNEILKLISLDQD